MMNEIILASASPRRVEILKNHGLSVTVMPADIDETVPANTSSEVATMFIALKKALSVEKQCLMENTSKYQGMTLIAADTVVYNDQIIGKPLDRNDAYRIISNLSGKSHQVITGVCLLSIGSPHRHCFYDITTVHVNPLSEEDINSYLDTSEPYDKAGAYGIQGVFKKHISHIEGDLDNVIGLPYDRLAQLLQQGKF